MQALIPRYITIISGQMSPLLEKVNKNERYSRGDLTPLVPLPYIEINHAARRVGVSKQNRVPILSSEEINPVIMNPKWISQLKRE